MTNIEVVHDNYSVKNYYSWIKWAEVWISIPFHFVHLIFCIRFYSLSTLLAFIHSILSHFILFYPTLPYLLLIQTFSFCFCSYLFIRLLFMIFLLWAGSSIACCRLNRRPKPTTWFSIVLWFWLGTRSSAIFHPLATCDAAFSVRTKRTVATVNWNLEWIDYPIRTKRYHSLNQGRQQVVTSLQTLIDSRQLAYSHNLS
jgi:hypothetical protein